MRKYTIIFFIILMVLATTLIMTSCGNNGHETQVVPDTPENVWAVAGTRKVTVTWSEVDGADSYNLYWNNSGGVSISDNKIAGITTSPLIHTGLILFKTYYYVMTAENALGESVLSNEVSALPALIPEELQKRIVSDAQADDNFGLSVSISGDYAIVGAYNEDDLGTNSGAAYIFYRNQGGADQWGEVTKLTASDAQDSDLFGYAVSISGDYAIVGAYNEDGLGTDRGAAYIFYRNQGGADQWGEVTKLTALDAQDNDYFGYAVSISGDYAIIGAYGEDGLGTFRGAAYIFYRNQGGADQWGEVAKLTASDAQDSDLFGYAVSISGDYAIVGAYNEDGLGTDRGAAYIFYRNQGGADQWGEVTKLTASDADDSDLFGCSVSISGDYAIVGAYGEDSGASNGGAIYIY